MKYTGGRPFRNTPFSQHLLFATLPPFRNTFLTNLCFASGPLFATLHLIRKIFDPKIGKNGQKWRKHGSRNAKIDVQAKITLNRHFFETKPCFFDFVPKPTLLVNFSVYFDFLKFFKPKKTVGLKCRFCFRFSKMPFWDLDGFSVFCQKPTVSKLKFWIWKLQKVSVFDSNRNHLKYEIWMIH